MPEMIQIEGDLVRVIDTTVVREARLADLLPHMEHRPPITVGPIPKSAKYLYWDESDPKNKRVQMLCELAPGIRTCRYSTRQYILSIPWTYFLFDFRTADETNNAMWQARDSRIFWAREEVKNLDSMLATALVPNCNEAGGICYGTTGVPVDLPLDARIDRLVHEFYATTFMHDSGTGSPWQSETGSATWKRWDEESKKNPHAWQNFPEWETKKVGQGAGRIQYRSVRSILGSTHDRTQPIQVTGMIPEMVMPFTFGRAEEWLQSDQIGATEPERAQNRHRLLVALQNLQAEQPAVVAPPPAAQTAQDDPGGVEIPNP